MYVTTTLFITLNELPMMQYNTMIVTTRAFFHKCTGSFGIAAFGVVTCASSTSTSDMFSSSPIGSYGDICARVRRRPAPRCGARVAWSSPLGVHLAGIRDFTLSRASFKGVDGLDAFDAMENGRAHDERCATDG